jgi:nanoRNase/pAp phosphatase (c-di-AMP/oligoRNAs hydrolase)
MNDPAQPPVKRDTPAATKLEQLREILDGAKTVLIVMQDYPDPDAIASAAGLRAIANDLANTQCFIAHGGRVGRAENRAMVKYLNINLHPVRELDFARFDRIATVDTQPGSGNNSLPDDVIPDIVIDHHRVRSAARRAAFTDIRRKIGATSTILHEYLVTAGIPLEPPLATALLYGIRSDTQDLGRDTTRADIEAVLALFPLANKRALSKIERERVPRVYFRMLADALNHARAYQNCVVAGLGRIDNPDMIGEVADLLLRDEQTAWSLCYGFCGGKALISIRTSDLSVDAGKTAKRVAGRKGTAGGHNTLAGAQIPLTTDTAGERHKVQRLIVTRFLRAIGSSETRSQALLGDT